MIDVLSDLENAGMLAMPYLYELLNSLFRFAGSIYSAEWAPVFTEQFKALECGIANTIVLVHNKYNRP